MKFRLEIVFTILIIAVLSACEAGKNSEKKLIINQNSSKEERIVELNKPVFCLSVVIPNSPNPKRRAIGTGFLVSENLLATAFHVKEDLDKEVSRYLSSKLHNVLPPAQIMAWKKFENGDYLEFPLNLAGFDQDSDLALFSFEVEDLKQQAKTREITPFLLADRLPDLGEDILSIGYYSEMEFPFNSLGNVSTIENGEDIYSDLTLMPGNSGSPLISMKTGEVLGLNIKVMTMGDGTIRLGISKKISKLQELIKRVNP